MFIYYITSKKKIYIYIGYLKKNKNFCSEIYFFQTLCICKN